MKSLAELTEGISTFEDVCAKRGDKVEDVLPFPSPINEKQFRVNDRERLDYIAEYLQDGYKADYSKWDSKWFPYFSFDSSKSAFGFAGSYCDHANTDAIVGSRLSFPTKQHSDFFGKQFIEIHNKVLTGKHQ